MECPKCTGYIMAEICIEEEGRVLDVRCVNCGTRFFNTNLASFVPPQGNMKFRRRLKQHRAEDRGGSHESLRRYRSW